MPKHHNCNPFCVKINFDEETIINIAPEIRRVADLMDFLPGKARWSPVVAESEKIVYQVYTVSGGSDEAHLTLHLTKIHAGKIGNYFYFTKGHYHVKNCAEIYVGIKGRGVVLLKHNSNIEVVTLEKGVVVYIPPGWAHRTVNIGSEPLVFLSVHRADAGYDYETIKKAGFGKRVVASDVGYTVEDE